MAANPHLTAFDETSDDQEIVAANIRALMARYKINQETLAEIIGVKQAAFSKRLAGQRDFSIRELGLIARFFGKTLEDLVSITRLQRANTSREQGQHLTVVASNKQVRKRSADRPLMTPVR